MTNIQMLEKHGVVYGLTQEEVNELERQALLLKIPTYVEYCPQEEEWGIADKRYFSGRLFFD
jgi:hypothetical protein